MFAVKDLCDLDHMYISACGWDLYDLDIVCMFLCVEPMWSIYYTHVCPHDLCDLPDLHMFNW